MEHWTNFVPIFFMAIKVIVLGVCGFFAIKWHFDEEKRVKAKKLEAETENKSDVIK